MDGYLHCESKKNCQSKPAEENFVPVMHNPQYRIQVTAQNNGYNQPPHTDFYLDSVDYTRPEENDI